MHVLIIGAGLSGLSCALELSKKGNSVTILEADNAIGGRMQTEVVDGFRLDKGFQVAFTGYPALGSLVGLSKLDSREFEPGALFWDGEKLNEVHRERLSRAIGSGYLGIADKIQVLAFSSRLAAMSEEDIFSMPDMTGEQFLLQEGLSQSFIDRFAKPFFGGIFLDRSLSVSAQMLSYIWKVLDRGKTVLPALGIAGIPKAIADQLPLGSIRLNTRVTSIKKVGNRVTGVEVSDGSTVIADHVVIACDAFSASHLTGQTLDPGSKQSICLYFEAPRPPVTDPILVLNGTGLGLVNHVVPVSQVSPYLAPSGRHLVSATILGGEACTESHEKLAERAKKELISWFPNGGVRQWKFLRGYRIANAQMQQVPGFRKNRPESSSIGEGLWIAGEFMEHGSIEGAILSGQSTAARILETM